MQRDIAVAHRNWLDPIALVRSQVGLIDQAASASGMLGDGFGEFAMVKVIAFAGGNALQGICLAWANEVLTRQWRTALRSESLAVTRLRQEFGHLCLPLTVYGRGHHVTKAGVTQGRLEQLGKGHAAKAVRQRTPCRHGARYRDGIPAAQRHVIVTREMLRRPFAGRAAGGVEAMHLVAVPDDGKRVSADAVHTGFDHGQSDSGGQRGIDRVAATRQHQQASCGG